MSDILLTAYPGSILGPIAKLLGILMDWIYSGISNITGGRVESVVLSIVIITIIIYMCLLPLTIKQQKFSKLSQKMQPEMQAIQAKYKNTSVLFCDGKIPCPEILLQSRQAGSDQGAFSQVSAICVLLPCAYLHQKV